MRRKARFTMKEVVTLIKAAQKQNARLVIELDEAGKFRVVINELSEQFEPREDMVF